MGQIQTIQESLSVFQLILLCFSPLLPFLYFEIIIKFRNQNDDDDDDFDGGINIFSIQT
tara:strand:- start:425 stop:601 length:177 start_codon:yes stop_codon:yes gene_type:complete